MDAAMVVNRSAGRPPLPTLAKWTAGTLIGGTLLLVYMQIFLFRSFNPPVALIFGIPALIFAALIGGVRRRWVPVLGAIYWVMFLAANAPYMAHDLRHPEIFTNFAVSIVLMIPALVGMAAGIGAVIQNYRASRGGSLAGENTRPGLPRWFTVGLTALAGVSLGAIAVAGAAPAGASAGVSPEAMASLPALTAANHHFGTSELHAQVGETVALRLENDDSAGHSFDIDELGVHVSMPPGEPALALFKASAPGTYTFYCGVPGHREAGMVGTLVVEP